MRTKSPHRPGRQRARFACAAFCTVMAALAGCGGHAKPSPSIALQKAATSTTSRTVTPASGPATVGPTSTAPSIDPAEAARRTLLAWETKDFPAVNAVLRAVQSIITAGEKGEDAALNAACQNLEPVVAHARATLPSPDRTLTSLLQSAFVHLDNAAKACLAYDDATAQQQISLAANALTQVIARQKALGG